jgi:hypothetical protein
VQTLPFNTDDLDEDEIALLLYNYNYLASYYDIQFIEVAEDNTPWRESELLREYENLELKYALCIKKDNKTAYLLWPNVYYETYSEEKGLNYEFRVSGAIKLQKSYEHCIFQTKTIADKVANIISLKNFKTGNSVFDKYFQLLPGYNRYMSLTNDAQLLEKLALLDMKQILFELKGNNLILATNQLIQPELNAQIIEYLFLVLEND